MDSNIICCSNLKFLQFILHITAMVFCFSKMQSCSCPLRPSVSCHHGFFPSISNTLPHFNPWIISLISMPHLLSFLLLTFWWPHPCLLLLKHMTLKEIEKGKEMLAHHYRNSRTVILWLWNGILQTSQQTLVQKIWQKYPRHFSVSRTSHLQKGQLSKSSFCPGNDSFIWNLSIISESPSNVPH